MRPSCARSRERPLPRCLTDGLDDDVGSVSIRGVLHCLDDVVVGVAYRHICTELARPRELLRARGGDDGTGTQGAAELERCEGDTAADPPDEDPLAFLHCGLRDEHAVSGLERERECGALLEREPVVERVELAGRNRLQFAVRSVRVLADDRDATVMRDPRIDDDAFADLEALCPFPEGSNDPGTVGTEDPRLRNRGEPLPDPDIEMVQPRGPQGDEYLTRRGLGIGDVLVPDDLGPAVFVDANSFHEAESCHDRRRAE